MPPGSDPPRHAIADAAELGLDAVKLAELVARARREVDAGLLPSCQLAVAREGRLALFETIGDAGPTTRYCVFSCTKGILAGAMWLVIGDGRLDASTRVAEVFPEFAANGKEAVTVEHLLTHTAGFPRAPMDFETAADRAARTARMASWRLEWEPGTDCEYHPTSAHWVLAELIDRVTGQDYRDFIHERIALPLGLPTLRVGVPLDQQDGIADVVPVGEPPSADELMALAGVTDLDLGEVTDDNLQRFNEPAVRALGQPAGGGYMTAADLALYYQALLHNPGGIWKPDVLADGTGRVRNHMTDRLLRVPANRSLGVQLAGDDGLAPMRSFGTTNSPGAFGHPGAHGQIGWADPATGISFAYCTNGLDAHLIREARRSISLSSRAAACAGAPPSAGG